MNRQKKEALTGYLFASPWLLGILIFLAYPLVSSLYFSLCDYSVLKKPMYIGAENYQQLLQDDVFWQSAKNTLFFAVLSVPFSLLLALALAMLLNNKVRGLPIYRTIFFLPSLVPQVPLAILFMWLLNDKHGIINNGLTALGMAHPPEWLGKPEWTKYSLIIMGLWGVGNTMLIFLASLQEVPVSLVEAADLDGAGAWSKVRNITLPMISPVILFNLIMGMIGALQVFAVPYVMFAGGGPDRSAYMYSAYLFDNAFRYNKMGYASAMGWIMFLVILVLTLIVYRAGEKKVYYEGG